MEAQVLQATTTVNRTTLPVYNLSCGGGGAHTIDRALRRIAGVKHVYVNPATEMAYVAYDATLVDVPSLVAAIEQAGFGAPRVHSAPRIRSVPLPQPQATLQLDSRSLALAGGLWLAAIYTLCVAADLLFPQVFDMQLVWEILFVGIDWANPWTLLLGLVEAFLYGAFGAWFLAVTYNALPKRSVA
jgi:cation transport ATPase